MAAVTTPIRPTSRPNTPLRRISASSLRASSLSHSRSQGNESKDFSIEHLMTNFQDLGDSLEDLTKNLARLNGIHQSLDDLSENFGSYLFGLRVGSYLSEVVNHPTAASFKLFEEREIQRAGLPTMLDLQDIHSSESEADDRVGNETTFHTIDSESFMKPEARIAARGRGSGRGRGTLRPVVTKRQAMEDEKFASAIIQLLPIKFREQQPERAQTEAVIQILKHNPTPLTVTEFGNKAPSIPAHRINDCLFALTKAKVAIRENSGGVSVYRLDHSR